jgi:uncharacterized protein
MEKKHFAIKDFKADDETRTIEGYGSIFGNEDSYGDVVVPGAFGRTLQKSKPRMLWQHRTDQIAGVWDEVREESKGLYLKGRLANTPLGNEAYELLKMGGLDGLSIGYGTVKSSTDPKRDVRLLQDLDLYEVSLVTFPANAKATVTGVKAALEDIDRAAELIGQAIAMRERLTDQAKAAEPEALASLFQILESASALFEESDEADDRDGKSKHTPRTLERILREAGLSKREARGFVAKGYPVIAPQRDADANSEITSLFNQFR